jgi:hypothetical protein
MTERLDQLRQEKARLEQTLSEVNVLIDAYERALKEQEKKKKSG